MNIGAGLLIALSLIISACGNKPSEQPPYRSDSGSGPSPVFPASAADQYFANRSWCQTTAITVNGVECMVDYRHSYARTGKPAVYDATVSVVQGCGGQSAAELSATLTSKADYTMDCSKGPANATMTQKITGQSFAVELKYNVDDFSLLNKATGSVATFTDCK